MPLQDLQRVLDVRLVDRHGLEAALQRGVLFDVLAVLVEGGGADDLNLAPGQGGLEDVGGVHAALGVARAHDVVDLVDDEDDVARPCLISSMRPFMRLSNWPRNWVPATRAVRSSR